LEEKVDEIAEDTRDAYRERIDYLKGVKDKLSLKLEEYENIADGKWDVVKDSAADFFVSVSDAWKENYAKVADAFKKEDAEE
jgi:hemoglobin-like flavoprotein